MEEMMEATQTMQLGNFSFDTGNPKEWLQFAKNPELCPKLIEVEIGGLFGEKLVNANLCARLLAVRMEAYVRRLEASSQLVSPFS